MKKKKVVEQENNEHSYFYSLELEMFNCFKDKQTLDLSDGKGTYSQWTIILGDNGTGKTTLLRVLDRIQPYHDFLIKGSDNQKLLKIPIATYDNYVKKGLLPETAKVKLSIFNNAEGIIPNTVSITDDAIKAYSLLISNVFLLSYGASRRMSKNQNISSKEINENKITSLFNDSIELINAEEWFLQKEWASIKSEGLAKEKFETDFNKVKSILIDILPDVSDIQSKPIDENNSKPILEVQTSYGWVSLRNLSFGYQTLTALIVDIASKMMEQYPKSNNPLEEPVIILIDEIDLHLHPKWQRTVIDKLSQHFPKAQFIATSHSPLIVQAALDKKANIVVCRKEGDKVIIDNNPDEVKGWRIDQILTSDLFELSSSQSILFEEIRNEKTSILLKGELTDSDKQRLDFINQKLSNSPVFSSKEAINAEELIKKAADLLKK
ncbi:AAA family ATPase [Flavobacterium sp. TR2]|uniref:AAA family ATPase n=1 Tax=Flavobacterium sp. TR2 TaxID=2977321 RepID=UPI0021B15067|nr:AAA family ATPase [Flavobacterium sp. TR2]UWY29257.1 AAA family ATPase [Flavobacterium sp. TR2]